MRASKLMLFPCLVVLMGAIEAQEAEQFGTVQAFEATADGGTLLLSGGKSYLVPKAVYDANRDVLNGLQGGTKVAFVLDPAGRVSRVRVLEATDDDGSRRRVYMGKYVKVEQSGALYWLHMDEYRWPISLDVYKKSELPFMRRGNPIRVVVEKGHVAEVARGANEEIIKPEDWERIQRSQRNDPVRVNNRDYKFLEHDLQAIKVSPKLPDGTNLGTETIKLEDVKSFENPAADARAGDDGGERPREGAGDVLEQANVRVGDTLGLGLDSGQVISLTEETCELRVWRNEAWGPTRSWKRAEIVGPVRRVSLTSQSSVPSQGGEIRLRLERSRSFANKLLFKVDVEHSMTDQVLVGAKLRFHLGGLGLAPGTRGDKIDIETVPVLFAGQIATITRSVLDDTFLDGWVEVGLEEGAVVPLASPGAKTHLMAAISSNPTDLNELTKVYEAAGGNGDEDLLRILIERAIYPPEGPIEQPKHAEAALAGLERAGDKSARLIVGDLFFLDRNLKRASLQRSGELIYEPLNRLGTEPTTYKKELVKLMGRLPAALRGEFGQRVFTLFLEREDLSDAIQSAFAARPKEAMDTLLEIATSTHSGSSPEEIRRAEMAAALLHRMGDAVLEEMLRELRKRDISVVELQAERQKPNVNSGDVVDKALSMLIQDAGRRRRTLLDQRVNVAADLEVQEKWTEALAVLREVLSQDPAHEGALERLPGVLVSLARTRRAEARGDAAKLLEEASSLLPAARKMLADSLLAEIYLEAAREDSEGLSIRAAPSPCARRLRVASAGEILPGKVADSEWVELQVGDAKGYLRTNVVREAGPGSWVVSESDSPRDMVVAVLDQVRKLSSSLETSANEVEGQLLARDGEARYAAGDYQGALPLFERARILSPTDPRLALERSAWMKANMSYLLAVGAVVLVGVAVGVMQLIARPRRVRFSGEFKHYGANRSARERDLDLGEEGAGAAPPSDGAAG